MRCAWIGLALLAGAAFAQESDEPGDALEEAIAAPIECGQPSSFDPLFEIAASGTVEGAEPSEMLAEANENAFLKCPKAFLLALAKQSRETQDGVLNYFGLRHEPTDLGRILRTWKNDPQVGPLVRTRFTALLDAK